MKVLVTGHNGYIGSVLTPMLNAQGFQVVGLDTDFYSDCWFGDEQDGVPGLRKDIRDVSAKDLEGFQAVIHLAALSNDPLGDLDAELTFDINYKASVRLARLSRQAGVERFVFSSSCSNYGAAGEAFRDELSPLNPVSAYGISKVKVEEEVSQLAGDSFSPVFLRNATAYGASPRLRCDLVLNNLVAWAFTTGRVLIKSDGTPWRPLVHVEDICRAFVAALVAPREAIHNEIYNIGMTEENYQVRELADLVEKTVPGCRIEYEPGGTSDPRCYRVDCSKVRRQLPEFQPKWNAAKGVRELFEAYRKTEFQLDDFEGSRYMRIRRIHKLLGSRRINKNLRWTAHRSLIDPTGATPPQSSVGAQN